MAAKPPKPPANLLKSNNNNNSNNNSKNLCEELSNHILNRNLKKSPINYHINEHNLLDEIETTITTEEATATTPSSDEGIVIGSAITTATGTKSANQCNCTNIGIMHLFHEMKQEFPTIPDSIVTQCVNENCHQRENCIQMLKQEFALHPIPVQTYPAKVLQQQQLQQQQQQLQQQQLQHQQLRHKPPTPLKPIRVAPTQPPNAEGGNAGSAGSVTGASQKLCQEIVKNSNNINNNNNNNRNKSDSENLAKDVRKTKTTTTTTTKPSIVANHNNNYSSVQNHKYNSSNKLCSFGESSVFNSVDMPTTNFNEMHEHSATTTATTTTSGTATTSKRTPRARPNTLNLSNGIQPQTLQQRQLSIQLQQRLQQRQQQHQQHQQQQQQKQHQQPLLTTTLANKPLRKAPLPPLPPKPSSTNIIQQHAFNQQLHHQQQQQQQQQQQHNYSNDSAASSCLPSPMSSSESEMSVNVSLSSPATTPTKTTPAIAAAAAVSMGASLSPSPQRHRSVLTLQPEPPYTRDFLPQPMTTTTMTTSSSSSSSTPSTPNGGGQQRGYVSVNLTLRPPNLNASASPPSTIDIFAGPAGPNGVGSGLTYRSESYDPRRGYQKNFQLTVTDESGGGVFSASQIRPRNISALPPPTDLEYSFDGGGGGGGGDGGSKAADAIAIDGGAGGMVSGVITTGLNQPSSLQFMPRQTREATANTTTPPKMPEVFPYPTQTQNHVVASNYNSNNLHATPSSSSFESPATETSAAPVRELIGSTDEILQRQKTRRDKLATALRDNKKRLSHLEQEINVLTDLVPHGESERLDRDIHRLRCDITQMLNDIENARRTDPSSRQQLQEQHQHQQPQPFPFRRQHPPTTLRLASQTSAPSSMSSASAPSSAGTPTLQQVQQMLQHPHAQQTPNLDIIQHHSPIQQLPPPLVPPTYEQYYQQLQQQQLYQQLQFQQQQQRLLQQQQQQHNRYQPHQMQSSHHHHHHRQQLQQPQQQIQQSTDEEEYYSDSDGLADDDDDDEPLEMWSCNMCTFRNHPQLNICEACENVRILPGTIRLVSSNSNNNLATGMQTQQLPQQQQQQQQQQQRTHQQQQQHHEPSSLNTGAETAAGASSSASTSVNLENDANLTQQQLQQFPLLHT